MVMDSVIGFGLLLPEPLSLVPHPAVANPIAAARATAAKPRRRVMTPIRQTPLRSQSVVKRGAGPAAASCSPFGPTHASWGCVPTAGPPPTCQNATPVVGLWSVPHIHGSAPMRLPWRFVAVKDGVGAIPFRYPKKGPEMNAFVDFDPTSGAP